jgi:aconitate hydratase
MSYEIAKTLYGKMQEASEKARKRFGRPVTFAEKILAAHADDFEAQEWARGKAMLALRPDRVAMQDATAQMAMLQFMQSGRKRAALPSSIHCDHLILGKEGAGPDLAKSLELNKEVFAFLGSAAKKYGIGFWKPGAGIIHQIVLENYAFPGGLMIGTDSHTPNAGGIGMMGVGVGGADAGEVMAGLAWEVLHPKLIGVKLTGKLSPWASPKDVILKLLGMLTVKGGTNKIVEYFGDGAASFSCTGKATITNMGAELGATSSIFAFDASIAAYLRATNRADIAELAEAHADLLRPDAEVMADPAAFYDEFYEIDLSTLESHVVGPHTPDLARPVSKLGAEARSKGYPLELKAALIGSCTNASYEDMSKAADLAKQALDAGLKPKAPLYISPGSERIRRTMERDGMLETFARMGAIVLTNSCGPCIGQWVRPDAVPGRAESIISSFNRNFPGRNDGVMETHAFIAGPELVTAQAFGGCIGFDPSRDDIGGFRFKAPQGFELPPAGFAEGDEGFVAPAENGDGIQVEVSPTSERLALLEPFPKWDGQDFAELPLLIKTLGKTTTDHISPAGKWLKFRGHLDRISDNMLLGAKNAYTGETGKTANVLSGETAEVAQVARAYKAQGLGSIIVGDENYGEGSSREHAAMCPRYLGVKAVLVKSFARIHETNLKKQGILALTFADPADWAQVDATDRISITGLSGFAPGQGLTVTLKKADGRTVTITANHTFTDKQIQWFKAGSALNALGE